MIEAAIFDFDGVILESAEIKTSAFQTLFEKDFPEHITEILSYHKKNMGISRFKKFRYYYENLFKLPYDKDVEKDLGEKFTKIVLEQILKAPFVPGALEFLKEFSKYYKLFVASGTEEKELHYIAKERGVYNFFLELHGGHRTKSEIINDIINRYKFKKENVIFVGDAESDLIASEESKLPYFIARIGTNEDRLKKCTFQIPDLIELNKIINKINVSK